MHPELEGEAILVSGHHGFTHRCGNRLIIDTSGGKAGDHNPIEAVIFPSRKLVSSTKLPAPHGQRASERFQKPSRSMATASASEPPVRKQLTQLEQQVKAKAAVEAAAKAKTKALVESEATRKSVNGVLIKFAARGDEEDDEEDEEQDWGE
jgi:hypothetical protein